MAFDRLATELIANFTAIWQISENCCYSKLISCKFCEQQQLVVFLLCPLVTFLVITQTNQLFPLGNVICGHLQSSPKVNNVATKVNDVATVTMGGDWKSLTECIMTKPQAC